MCATLTASLAFATAARPSLASAQTRRQPRCLHNSQQRVIGAPRGRLGCSASSSSVWDAWPQREEPFSWRWLEATAEGDGALRHCALLLKAFADVWVDSLYSACLLTTYATFLNPVQPFCPEPPPK